jgi:hypothetical protein
MHDLRLPVVLFAEGGGGRPGDTRPGPASLDMLTFLRFTAQWSCADDRHHQPLLLRRQRGSARLLRRHHRHQGGKHRHGRAGDGRGRWPRGRQNQRRSDRRRSSPPTADRHSRGGRGARRGRGQEVRQLLPRNRSRVGVRGPAVLRRAVPENWLRAYDVRDVITLLADTGSVLELRPFLLGQRHHHGAKSASRAGRWA